MAGVVLETLSTKKLVLLSVVLFILQVVAYLIGGVIAPKPFNAQQVLSRICKAPFSKWSYLNYPKEPNGCAHEVPALQYNQGYSANDVTFAFQFPLIRENQHLDMSRWHQNMFTFLIPEIKYEENNQVGTNPVLTMHIRLGAYNKHKFNETGWIELARSQEVRPLKCHLPTPTPQPDTEYVCEPLHLFELGSVHYDYYLINIWIPAFNTEDANETVNHGIGAVKELNLIVVHQNGGFTKVWLSLKAVMLPFVLTALIWFWRRVLQLPRAPNLLEKMLFVLGVVLTFLNLPVEFLTLWLYMPYMLLFSDVRQGLFYSFLLCFWVIFAGEHQMDQTERNHLRLYWKQLSGVALACIALFVFDVCERGVKLYNPFFSVWSTTTSKNLAYTFIIVAGIAACIYFVLLSVMMIGVIRQINAKKSNLEHMSKQKRKYFKGIIFRFTFLMIITMICAALTVIYFIIGNVSEGQWRWEGETTLEYTSAFLTGSYGMWNIYVVALLCLYAPSHKQFSGGNPYADSSEDENATVEFSATEISNQTPAGASATTEASALTSFIQKAAAD